MSVMESFPHLSWQELGQLVLQEYKKQLIFKHWEESICQGDDHQFDLVERAFLSGDYSLEQLPLEQRFSLQIVGNGISQIWQETQANREYLLQTLTKYFQANLAFESCFQELFVI